MSAVASDSTWRLGTRAGTVITAVLLLVLAYLAISLGTPGEEDAFIYFRYALNWAHGQGLAFNPGQPVEGFSSPIWMAVLAWATRLGAAPHFLARVLSLLCGLATVLASVRLAAALGGQRLARLGVALTLGLNFWFLNWSQSGLETAGYSLILTLATTATLRALSPGATPLAQWRAGGWLGLTALARPEGLLFALLVVLRAERRDGAGRTLLRIAAPPFAMVGAYAAWRYATFGSWLPNTSVKLYPLHVDRSLPQAVGFIAFLGGIGLLLPAVALVRGRRAPGSMALGDLAGVWIAGLALSLGFHLLAGGDYRSGFRYMIPALPLLLAAAWRSGELLMAGLFRPRRLAGGAALAFSLLASSLLEWRANPWTCWRPDVALARWRDPFAERSHWGVSAAFWLLENVPDHSLVAYGQMGKAPYLLTLRGRDVRFLDTVGWVDRDVAQLYRFDRKVMEFLRDWRSGLGPAEALARGRDARARRFVDLLLARRPDFILIEPHLQHTGVSLLQRDSRLLATYERLPDIGPPPLIAVYRRRAPS